MATRPLVILGSARSDGETRRAMDIAFPHGAADLIILPHHHIGGYDYAHRNDTDEFPAVIDRIQATDTIVFATPVYWYAMSAPLKIFFDRFTDLLETMKDKGRILAGKDVWLIATGTEAKLPAGFEVPFRRTAEYFAMQYRGGAYLYTGPQDAARARSEAKLAAFGAAIYQ